MKHNYDIVSPKTSQIQSNEVQQSHMTKQSSSSITNLPSSRVVCVLHTYTRTHDNKIRVQILNATRPPQDYMIDLRELQAFVQYQKQQYPQLEIVKQSEASPAQYHSNAPMNVSTTDTSSANSQGFDAYDKYSCAFSPCEFQPVTNNSTSKEQSQTQYSYSNQTPHASMNTPDMSNC